MRCASISTVSTRSPIQEKRSRRRLFLFVSSAARSSSSGSQRYNWRTFPSLSLSVRAVAILCQRRRLMLFTRRSLLLGRSCFPCFCFFFEAPTLVGFSSKNTKMPLQSTSWMRLRENKGQCASAYYRHSIIFLLFPLKTWRRSILDSPV